MANKRLLRELQTIVKEPNYYYSCYPKEENLLIWDFCMIGPPDSLYEYGTFNGIIEFTNMYPNKPPTVIFSNILHPNIYTDGKVCISILHEGVDVSGYENDYERWNPSHSINTIMLSIMSMLSSPNFDSPANVDAKILWQDNIEEYRKIIYKMVKNG